MEFTTEAIDALAVNEVEIMKKIAQEAEKTPELLADAPHNTPVRKVDETKAISNASVSDLDALKQKMAEKEPVTNADEAQRPMQQAASME